MKDYIDFFGKVLEKMEKLSDKRFWAIWALFAMFAAGYILSALAQFFK